METEDLVALVEACVESNFHYSDIVKEVRLQYEVDLKTAVDHVRWALNNSHNPLLKTLYLARKQKGLIV
jgi:intein-encoded DNA endonuclease-like protein